jgi:diguanylate cyclase (GGDEF)-like protein
VRWRTLILCWWLVACGWLATGPGAQAAEPPPAIVLAPGLGPLTLDGRAQYWVEPTQHRTVEEIAAAGPAIGWAPLLPGQQHRLDGGALWVRFQVQVRDPDRWYVTIGSSGIDRVQLFRRNDDGRWIVEEAGDTRPVSQWPVPGRLPTFELAEARAAPVTYFLRIEHERVDYAAPITLTSQATLLAAREREQFLFGAYFGVAALLAVVALANTLAHRDRYFGTYAVYLIVYSLGQAAYLGVGAQHLWEPWLEWNAQATFVLPGLSAAAALWFVQVVTEPARFSRVLQHLVWGMIAGLLLTQVLEILVPSRSTLALRLALTTATLVLVAVLIGLVWIKGEDPDIRIIALGFVPVLVMALPSIARGFNLIPNSLLTRYGLAIGSALEMPILFYALSLRAGRRREAQTRASALPRTDALTGLADRRTLLQRMDALLARARSQKHQGAMLMAKLANYDLIVSEYGRETVERAVVVAAAHLRRAAADIDLAARVAEREFALLLEGPTTPDIATSRAQQIVASGLRSNPALPPDLTLRLTVVVAMLPGEQPDAAASLQWLQGALAAVRPESRKQIRSLNF